MIGPYAGISERQQSAIDVTTIPSRGNRQIDEARLVLLSGTSRGGALVSGDSTLVMTWLVEPQHVARLPK